MNRSGLRWLSLIVVICVIAGALAGIAGSAAAPSSSSKSSKASKHKSSKRAAARLQRRGFRGGPFGPGFRHGPGRGGPPVHSEAVVPNANGDGFDTITADAGKLKTIDGTKLTVTEGTDKATYGEPTIDVGATATVFRNHQKAALTDLKEGDFVHIVKSPRGNLVVAEDAAFRAQEQNDRGGEGHGHFGPGDGPWPGGPGG